MFFPKRFKYKLLQKKRTPKLKVYLVKTLTYGTSACKPIQTGVITARHMRRLILFLKKIFKKSKRKYLWIPYFPHTPIFKKSINARMGRGKGKRVGWYSIIYPGLSFFETKGVRFGKMKLFGNMVISRLPFRVKYVSKKTTSQNYIHCDYRK